MKCKLYFALCLKVNFPRNPFWGESHDEVHQHSHWPQTSWLKTEGGRSVGGRAKLGFSLYTGAWWHHWCMRSVDIVLVIWMSKWSSTFQDVLLGFIGFGCNSAEEEFIGCVRIRTRMAIMFEQRVRELCDPLIHGAKQWKVSKAESYCLRLTSRSLVRGLKWSIHSMRARRKTPKDVWVSTCASWALVQTKLCLVSDKQEQKSSWWLIRIPTEPAL